MAGALTAMIAAAFSGVTPDPYFEYTTLLLPGNGTNLKNNNEFLDSSTNAFTITRNPATGPNAPTQGTFSPFSQTGWGNYFNGSSQYLSIADNTSLDFGSDNFTIETWIYLTAYNSEGPMIVNKDWSGASYQPTWREYILSVTSSGGVYTGLGFTLFDSSNAQSFNATGQNLNLNTWYHIAAVRNGTNISLYIDGVLRGSGTLTLGALNDTAYPVYVGVHGYTLGPGGGGQTYKYFPGYISNLRITKGRAVYTGAFTPPTTPLTRTTGGTNPPQGTECSLLTCQSNRFLDSNGVNTPASSPLTITAIGSPTVVAFSPFNPTASWSAATNGGSGYFDGSGDYLQSANSTAFNLGSNNFTIELWFYTSSTSNQTLISAWNTTSFEIIYFSGTLYCQSNATAPRLTTTSWPLNQWNHIAYVRSGSTYSAYLNGTRFATATDSASIPNVSSGPAIGARQDGTLNFNGYVSNARIVNGTAVYDPTQSTLTVPTAPLTAITNTSLLLNFTNAGIYDATSKNDLETVGNAQISTAISAKWGSGTIALDGNGDYLNSPSSQLNVFGTGDFTIEMWAYITDYTTGSPTFNDYGPFFDFRTANTSQVNVVLSFLSTFGGTGRPCMFINGAVTITGNVMTTNSWTHIALSRVSGVTRMYMGGDQAGSNYTDTNNYTSTVCTIGVNIARDAFLKGYIQDPRITRGYGRYVTGTGGNAGKMVLNGTNTLALPTAAFPTL